MFEVLIVFLTKQTSKSLKHLIIWSVLVFISLAHQSYNANTKLLDSRIWLLNFFQYLPHLHLFLACGCMYIIHITYVEEARNNRTDHHLWKQHKIFKGNLKVEKDMMLEGSSPQTSSSFPPSCQSSSYIFHWRDVLYSYFRHELWWYVLNEYMNYLILSRRQMHSEHICLDSNSCASWWNKTSGLKFVLCFTVYSSCYFHFKMQIIHHLGSQNWTTRMLAFLPAASFIKNIISLTEPFQQVIFSPLSHTRGWELCYANDIFCGWHRFLIYIHTEEKQMQKAS